MDDGLFGGLFDLNNDGATDVGEAAFGAAMLDKLDKGDDDDEGDEDDEDDSDREEAIECLQDELDDLELDEPEDAYSAAYDRREKHRAALEAKIAELEG